ncbi:hypothetical protein [Zhongshania marina]|uniref:Uncharacterized protein n=1 Tax=Zhongshania marina TaxID=2304603 RepID=A0ABX9W2N5_9GAMM|nr:hypothetical protein D0911_08445 [Zhongshania marina]
MKKNKMLTRLAASAILSGMVGMASAQDLPIIGGLLGGGLPSTGGLGGGGSLPLVGGLPVLGTFLPFVLGELPMSLTAIDLPIEKTLAGLGQVGGLVGAISGNPEALIRPVQHLALPVAFDVIPLTEVLFSNPAGLLDFLTSGGVLLMPDISLVPRTPLVNQPL